MARDSGGHWIVPAVVVLLPALMFYFWWSHLGNARRLAISREVRHVSSRSPFVAAPAGSELRNPIAGVKPRGGDLGAFRSPPPRSASGAKFNTPSAKDSSGRVSRRDFSASRPLQGSVALLGHSPRGFSRVSNEDSSALDLGTKIPPPPEIARDPTLSPEDIREIREMLAPKPKRVARRRRRKPARPQIESLIDLEGIISSSSSGGRAIVNGEVVGPGQSVHGAKVLRILPQKVIFFYKGRQFVKVIKVTND